MVVIYVGNWMSYAGHLIIPHLIEHKMLMYLCCINTVPFCILSAGFSLIMADQQPFRVAGNGVDELRQRPVGFTHGAFYNIRDQVFHALFHRLAIIYSRSVSRSWRRTFEFFMLFEVRV